MKSRNQTQIDNNSFKSYAKNGATLGCTLGLGIGTGAGFFTYLIDNVASKTPDTLKKHVATFGIRGAVAGGTTGAVLGIGIASTFFVAKNIQQLAQAENNYVGKNQSKQNK